ncbi:MAG TPA: DUF2569 family protein [Candidatus Aphodousia faecipullorum]|nr:DUF2569 family protein [Candidatus Aphodousia faecipullorum]
MIEKYLTPEFIMALGMLAVMVLCPTFLVYALAKKQKPARPIPHFPQGVQGWLLIFVATVVLSLILTVVDAINIAGQMRQTIGSVNWSFMAPYIVVCGLYLYCLWLITFKRAAFVVRQVIVILWVVGPISLLLLTFFFGATVPNAVIARSAIYAGLWTCYFLFSKRVACTYGTKAVDSYVDIALKMAQAQKDIEAKKDKN